jgi:hypothetical protein
MMLATFMVEMEATIVATGMPRIVGPKRWLRSV